MSTASLSRHYNTGHKKKSKRKSRSKKRLTGYKSVKRNEYTTDSHELSKYRAKSNTSDRKYKERMVRDPLKYKELTNLYTKQKYDISSSVKHSYRIKKEHSNEREEIVHTNRSRSEGSTQREKEIPLLKDTRSDYVGNKITIRDNYEARRKDLSKNKGPDGQLIYTFRENNEGSGVDDILDKNDTSYRSKYYHQTTIEPRITEKTIKMSKKDLLADDKFNTITRNNETLSQTLLSLKHGNKIFNNTGK